MAEMHLHAERPVGAGAHFGAFALAVVLALATCPVPAEALTISVPADATGPVEIVVRLDPGEPTGTVTLSDGPQVVGSTATTDGAAVFTGVALAPGLHRLSALLAGPGAATWSSAVALVEVWGDPGVPRLVAPPHRTVVSPVAVKAVAGASTSTLTLSVDGAIVRSVACRAGETVDLGKARLGRGESVLTVTATGRTGVSASASKTVKRKRWPHSTCIVVDKSDYRLYWVRGQQLVASYRIAHGRNNWTPTCTWKVLAKYRTDPHSVYGPRKMRLFRRVGERGHYRYVFTRYAIHGTNQPSSIGHQASHGCIRMYNRSVLKLWPQVPLGTFVVTRR